MLFFRVFLLVGIYISTSIAALSAENSKGPHGGRVIKEENQEYEIRINRASESLDVFANPDTSQVSPENMTVTLVDPDGYGSVIRMRAVQVPTTDGYLHYSGELGVNKGRLMGLEIQFDLSEGERKRVTADTEIPEVAE